MKNYLKAFLAVGAFLFASVGLADTTGEINSENFEGLTAGDSLNVETEATDGSILWASSDADDDGSMGGFAVVTAYETESESGGKNYLALETTNPLYRRVQGGGTAQDIGTGLYFEGDVQFSPYEEDVALVTDGKRALDDGTKLLVYIKGTEASTDNEGNTIKGTTNFVIVAGYYDEGNNTSTDTNYVCAVPDDFNYDTKAWHHLVIKSYLMSDKNHTYFKVLVDGKALSCSDVKGDSDMAKAMNADEFPSLDVTTDDVLTISSIGFKGTGKVDNLVWTTEDPEKEPEVMKQYKFVWTEGEGTPTVTTNTVSIGKVEHDTVYKFAEGIDVAWDFTPDATGYVKTEPTVDDSTGVTIVTFGVTAATVQLEYVSEEKTVTESFADFASAVARANKLTDITTTVKLLANASAEDSTGNGIAFSNATILLLNGKTLTITGTGFYGDSELTIADYDVSSVSSDGVIEAEAISSDALSIYGGKFSVQPTNMESVPTYTLPGNYTLSKVGDYWQLVADGGSTEPTIDGGDDNTKVDPETKTITVETSESGEITITGDASEYTISVPQNVTKITGSVGTITIMGKSESMTTAVDITGAFSVTTENNVTTIALDPDGKVTVNGVEVSVTPELDTTDGTEPFAVGDSVSATVKAIPGLTYSLMSSTDVSTVKASTTSECDKTADASGTVTLEDTNTEKPDAKFYVIKVSR